MLYTSSVDKINTFDKSIYDIKVKGLNPEGTKGLGVYYYPIKESTYEDNILPVSCTGHAMVREVFLYFFDQGSKSLLEVPVTTAMSAKFFPQIYHDTNYNFGAISVSYDVLSQQFNKEAYKDLSLTGSLPNGFTQIAKTNEFFYGNSSFKPKNGDYKLRYTCQRYQPQMLVIDSSGHQLLQRDIKATLDPNKSLVKQLSYLSERNDIKWVTFFLMNVIAVFLAVIKVLLTFNQSLLVPLHRLARNNFIILGVLLTVFLVPQKPFYEAIFASFLGIFFGARFIVIRFMRQNYY